MWKCTTTVEDLKSRVEERIWKNKNEFRDCTWVVIGQRVGSSRQLGLVVMKYISGMESLRTDEKT